MGWEGYQLFKLYVILWRIMMFTCPAVIDRCLCSWGEGSRWSRELAQGSARFAPGLPLKNNYVLKVGSKQDPDPLSEILPYVRVFLNLTNNKYGIFRPKLDLYPFLPMQGRG